MPRLSPVLAAPSSSRLAATASTSAPVKRSRKRSRHNLPCEREEEHQQPASSWLDHDGDDTEYYHSWPSFDGQGDSIRFGASSHRRHQRSDDNASLYDVVARIAASVVEERQHEQQQQQQSRRRDGRNGAQGGRSSGHGGESDDNDSETSSASSSSRRSSRSHGSGDSSGDGTSDSQSEDDDNRSKAFSVAPRSSDEVSSALIDPLVLSIQSGLETLLASLERRRQREQESRGSIGSKQRASIMSGADVLDALQTLVGGQRGRMRGLGDGRAEAVGGREVLEAVREKVVRRRKEMSERNDAGLGGEEVRGVAAASSIEQGEGSGAHLGVDEGEDEDDDRGQDITAADTSQSQQNPPQHPPNNNTAPAPRRRRPPSSKQPAQAATWFGDESIKSRKRRLDALLLLG